MNHILSSGQDVFLSIDLGVQAVLKREIQRQIDNFEAIGGAGVILDMNSGETIALASLPDFNPNQFAKSAVDARFNRATKGLYEMGSTFKVLNTAIALETGAVRFSKDLKSQNHSIFRGLKLVTFTPILAL